MLAGDAEVSVGVGEGRYSDDEGGEYDRRDRFLDLGMSVEGGVGVVCNGVGVGP